MVDMDEEIELAQRIKKGDKKAIDKLINANLRFVISIAKQYQNKGLPLVDLIQLGNLGLIESVTRWDESRGFKFISYAVWWIRQSIIQGISAECRTVRVPMNQIVNMNKINKATTKFEQAYHRDPTYDELAEEINVSSDKVSLCLSSINKSLSLDTPFNDEEVGTLLDVIPNKSNSDVDDSLIKESIYYEIDTILRKLSNREGDVLRLIFGIGTEVLSLDEIAARFGVGTERIRQIQKEALEKLRMYHSKELKELL